MRHIAPWLAFLAIGLASPPLAEAAPEDGEQVYRDRDARWSATVLPDGRVEFEDDFGPYFDRRRGLVVPGIAEGVVAARGQELYQARKRALLRSTEAMRREMAIELAETSIARQLDSLEQELTAIWYDASAGAVARRELIFERWDECEENPVGEHGDVADEGMSRIDAERRAAGAAAREKIVAFVREYLPASSNAAYTPAELERLNARRLSREPFEPYSGRPER